MFNEKNLVILIKQNEVIFLKIIETANIFSMLNKIRLLADKNKDVGIFLKSLDWRFLFNIFLQTLHRIFK